MHRDDFLVLKNNIIYFDNGATTLKPKSVRDAVVKYYDEYTHSYVYNLELAVADLNEKDYKEQKVIMPKWTGDK